LEGKASWEAMPWKNTSMSLQRWEFVEMARQPGAKIRELCRRYGISPTTAYKWLGRYGEEGRTGLEDRSRRPLRWPKRTADVMEELVVAVHERYSDWGARKLRRVLLEEGHSGVPAASTVEQILKRHGRPARAPVSPQPPYHRFTHPRPNDLWQMDFKGHFAMRAGRCHPLTVLDDHSRFALCLKACPAVNGSHVQPALEAVFRRFGLPERILCDNAGPWGTSDLRARYTAFGVWLLRLGVDIIHGRPFHPQTQGKCERFHRSFKVEVLNRTTAWHDLEHCQRHFDQWRQCYNHVRPHHALALATPASHYQPSQRSFPASLAPIEYLPDDLVRKAKHKGEITFQNHFFFIGQAFAGLPIALRPALPDGRFDVFFSWKKLGSIDLTAPLKSKFRYNPLLPDEPL
jgi:transposase InsO family protein